MKRYRHTMALSIYSLTLICLCMSCQVPSKQQNEAENRQSEFQLVVLGTLQDGGSPQAGCRKSCCVTDEAHLAQRRVVSLGLIDHKRQLRYLFEAGPDFPEQLQQLNKALATKQAQAWPDGIFISHAHIGHYSGLMHLGREAMNAREAKVYVMPRMRAFLEQNGPWKQLGELNNIRIQQLKADSQLVLPGGLGVKAILVPHRDEYSETVGFLIQGKQKRLLFIPDIDKWEKWDADVLEWIKTVDYALIDGTFYSADEVKNRNLSEIPHPLVIESMQLFQNLSSKEKNKIHFIHFNHTNPLLDSSSEAYTLLKKRGFKIATYKQSFAL